MNKDYTRYSITATEQEQRDILVAVLEDWGIEGFEETDGMLYASGNATAVDHAAIDNYLAEAGLAFQKATVPDQNWNALWESNFEPVQVDDFVAIRASFHEPAGNTLHEIVITPKMSFGTGHHATTYLVMQLMRHIDFTGATVFDYGTGTGILAILAEKLGAKHILALDYDDWCILNALENVEQNTCKNVVVEKGETPPADQQFQVVLANINKHIILQHMAALATATQPNGILILSGLLSNDEADILAATAGFNLKLAKNVTKNGWIALFFQKQASHLELQ